MYKNVREEIKSRCQPFKGPLATAEHKSDKWWLFVERTTAPRPNENAQRTSVVAGEIPRESDATCTISSFNGSK